MNAIHYTTMNSQLGLSDVITKAVEALSHASGLSQITEIIARSARALAGSDGTTFVLKEDDKCYYADENAISPLWKGRRFSIVSCISGWSMINRQIVCIENIQNDARVPQDTYRSTFVKSLCIVPIRSSSPIGAIGIYWSKTTTPSDEQLRKLQVLADCAAVAIENWNLKQALAARADENNALTEHYDQLSSALHILVHDLRSPITSILGFTELVRIRVGSSADERTVSYFDSITRTANRLNTLIGRMLAIHSMNHQEIQKQVTDLSIIAREISTQLQAQDPARKINFVIDKEMIAHADPVLIRFVIENLFGNAYKFTNLRDFAEIRFGCHSQDPSGATYFVRDNGIGFEQRETDKLFKPLSRLHGSKFSGTGLGLASVAQIVEAHGGSVRAEGQPDSGAAFYFSIPNAS